MIREIGALNAEMDAAGARFFAAGLESASHARSPRKQPDGSVSITDGPTPKPRNTSAVLDPPVRPHGRSAGRTDEPAQSSIARPRSFLEEDRCDFAVSRRTLEPSVGRLGRRVFGTTCALAISAFSRARASARLASCVRCTRDVIINTPSSVARLPANARRRCRTSAGSERDWPASKRSWTAVETLLTFWPPGPEARTKVMVSSESGMNMGKCYFQNSP